VGDALSVVNGIINLASCPVDGLMNGIFTLIENKSGTLFISKRRQY
jgi:hypothetical protein